MNLTNFQFQFQSQFQQRETPGDPARIIPITEIRRPARAYDTEAERVSQDFKKLNAKNITGHEREHTSITVTTAPELRRAIESRCGTIIVIGDLAEELQSAARITLLAPGALSELEAACATLEARKLATKIFTPSALSDSYPQSIGFTGGPLGGVLVAASEATGFNLSVIRTIAAVGFALILSLFDDYDLDSSSDGGKTTLRFKLKRHR